MIEAKTSFEDSGYDCDHCGGRVLIRTDKETGQPIQKCYQCELCGCQWQFSGAVLRVGQHASCIKAQHKRMSARESESALPFSPIFLIVGLLLFLVILVYFGGLVAIRFFIPIAIAIAVGFALFQFGKEKMWW